MLILSILIATFTWAQVTPCTPTAETYTAILLGVPGTALALPGECQLNTGPILNQNFSNIAAAINSLSAGSGYFLGTPTLTVEAGTPGDKYVVIANGPTSAVARRLTQDDILPGFSISSFSGGGSVEIGAVVTNPSFTASYSNTPTSASITNTDNVDSPLSLTSPYTSATVVGTFHKTTQTSTTFTLTAIGSSTQTTTRTWTWLPRSFAGVGSAGATATVTASGNNAVLSTSDVLTSLGLASSNVGATYGPFSTSSQKIYLLLTGGSHTFKDAVTGFAFVFNSPTSVSFVDQNGATETKYLYESTNALTGSYSVLVVN